MSSAARIEWFDPALIRFKISPCADLKGEAEGDWDIDRRFPLKEAVKYRSIFQRYADGRPWEETALFTEVYARRIQTEAIRGEPTMKGLLEQYYGRVDSMFAHMKRRGFVIADKRHLPKLLLGRDGEVFIGNQGNHRLAMAHVLGLKEIAGEVVCAHRLLNLSPA